MNHTSPCPCNSGKNYSDCCHPFHAGAKAAPTAEALMRSRFSAYALQLSNYIFKTWQTNTRPSKQSLKQLEPIAWKSLDIISTQQGSPFDQSGMVEFKAYYDDNGLEQCLHETSRFSRENNQWVYIDGVIHTS